jgi:hypothetical protein
MLENDPDDDIIVMVWHRDNEDALILLGWERTETLKSKVETQEEYSGEKPEKLAHLSARPMNELHDLGPNTAHLNQKPENPFTPGDRVVKASDEDASVAVVVEVLPPEKNTTAFGQTMDGEAVNVAFPEMLDDGPGDWRTISPAKLASYCDDQDIKLYTYKHTNLDHAEHPFVPGDYVIKPDYDDPDLAVVVDVDPTSDRDVDVAFLDHLDETVTSDFYRPPSELPEFCDEQNISVYSYEASSLTFETRD